MTRRMLLSALFPSCLLAMLLISAATTEAATLQNVSVVKNPANDADETGSGPRVQWTSNVFLLNTTTTSIASRYSAGAAIDSGALGGTHERVFESDYTLSFQVDADPGEVWRLDIATHIKGDLNLRDDNGLSAEAEVSAISGSFSPSVSKDSGTLSLTSPGSITGNKGNYLSFSPSATAMFRGQGPQAVSLTFAWTNRVRTVANLAGGDEGCIRLGEPTTDPNRIQCGEYPGDPERSLPTADGHFVNVTLLPEMPTAGVVENILTASETGRVLFEVIDESGNTVIDCAAYATFAGDTPEHTSQMLEDTLQLEPNADISITRAGSTRIKLQANESFSCRVCEVPGATNCTNTPQCPPSATLGTQFDIYGQVYDKETSLLPIVPRWMLVVLVVGLLALSWRAYRGF